MERTKSIIQFRRAAMILLVMMLTMAQTAWAGTIIETKTVTFYMDGGASGNTNLQGDSRHVLVSGGMTLEYKNNNTSANTIYMNPYNNQVVFRLNIISCGGFLEFTNLQGTVKKVEFTNVRFYNDMQMYVGKDKDDNSTLLHVEGNASDYDFPSIDTQEPGNATFEGSLAVSPSSPLRIMFSSSNSETSGYFGFRNGTIVVTYDVEVEITDDPGHTFTFAANASSDAIIATCTEGSAYHTCGLTNRQVTMPLEANDAPYDGFRHYASLNQTAFNNAGITDIAAILSYKDKSTNETLENPPAVIGSYTATADVTVTYKNVANPFTLTKDFEIYNGTIACDYPQFSFSPKPAIAGNDVTITFTPLAGEGIDVLTLTGDNTIMSLGHGITDNHNGTYTFTMVKESLTLDVTFSEPDASHFEQTGENEYTIKTANGWNWFCYVLNSGLVADGFSGKTVKLGTSIESSEMAGTSGHPFKGTFDGQGNTLTFNLQASEGYSAPFHYTDGATISNLHVTGLIEGNDISPLAGLVGKATGNITISNCHVSTQISTTHSGAAWHGGVIAFWYDSNVACTFTGCVYDGLIYNPSEAYATTYCSGFIGNLFGSNLIVTFTDCLFAPAAYGTGKYTLGDECYTFVYPNSSPTYNMTNCYYTSILGNRQGRPAATATVAPDNLGNAMTDHGMVDGYENGFLYDGNYYTPKYGDAVVEYRFNDWNERADVTINGTNNQGTGVNVVGVNITEEVGNIKSVTYNRPFNTAQAATVILPFDYTCNGSEGGKFYSFAGISVTAPIVEDDNHVTSLTANTPYLFVPTATTMTFPNISSMTGGVVTLQPTTGDHKVTSDDKNWTLVGSYSIKTWATEDLEIDKAYFINDEGKLEKIVSGMITAPTECYLLRNFEIVTPTVTAPTAIAGLVYTGSPQALVTAGSTDFGTLLYSTDGENYSADIPTATNAGTYTIYYKVEGSDNWNAVDAQTVEVTIAYYNASLADIVDNTDVISNIITNYGSKANVTLSGRTLYKDGKWNTLCLPFSLSAAQIAANANFAGATLMTMDVTEKNGFDVEDGTLYLWFKTATEIEAGMPYLVKWDKAADYDNNPSVYDIVSPVFEGVTISNSTAQTVESKTAGLETVQMVGTYSPVGVTADDKSILFLGDANTLYYSTVDRQIRSCRAYFSVPYINGHAGAKARAFVLSFDGEETTGILEVSANSNEVKDDVWYSLDGVRLSGKPTQRGMYINKGKKIVVK